LPDLSAVPFVDGEELGIIITMVTSMDNPKRQVFVHVNGIKYCANDAVDLSNGSIFLPLFQSDILQREKKSVERLGVIRCLSWVLLSLSVQISAPLDHLQEVRRVHLRVDPVQRPGRREREWEMYVLPSLLVVSTIIICFLRLTTDTVCNEDLISKVAKGKLFASEYNLLTYKFVFQLAVKKDDQYFAQNIQCETDLITDREFTSSISVACSITKLVLCLEKKVNKFMAKKPVAKKVASKTPNAKKSRRARKPTSLVKPLKRLSVSVSDRTK
jgi:hypothetical protein